MNTEFMKSLLDLVEQFENKRKETGLYEMTVDGFLQWICDGSAEQSAKEPEWDGKENGRTAESVISTLLVHLGRYGKSYSKSAIYGSEFSTQEEFIYLINLKAYGSMTKMQLIQLNVHEKPTGMQIISRLIKQGWIGQTDSQEDKRSKVIFITKEGISALEKQMKKIRMATSVVTGNLSESEKMQLIRLLQKLDHFHQPIYSQNLDSPQLLDKAYETITNSLN